MRFIHQQARTELIRWDITCT